MQKEAAQIEIMMRGYITTLTTEQQSRVNECFEKLRALRAEYGDEGEIAFALDGAISVQS